MNRIAPLLFALLFVGSLATQAGARLMSADCCPDHVKCVEMMATACSGCASATAVASSHPFIHASRSAPLVLERPHPTTPGILASIWKPPRTGSVVLS